MLLRLWRWILGYVEFEIYGRFPEKFLNLTHFSGINVWNQVPCGEKMTACMRAKNYRRILKIAKKSAVRLKITRKRGLYFILKAHKERKGLSLGLVLAAVLVFVLSNFIWVIEIQDSETVNYSKIKNALAENGVSIGAFQKNIDVLNAERRVMQDVQEVSWLAINFVGTTARVEFKSREPRLEAEISDKPCNILAKNDGVIVKMNVENGSAATAVGSGAAEGQLLVSAVIENPSGVSRLVQAKAQVIARTKREGEFFSPSHTVMSAPSGVIGTRKSYNLLWLKTPYSPKLLENSAYFQQKHTYCWELNGVLLPVGFTLQENQEYIPTEFEYTEAQCRENAYKRAAIFEAFFMPDVTIESRETTESFDENGFTLKINYTCLEDIAVSAPVIADGEQPDSEQEEP